MDNIQLKHNENKKKQIKFPIVLVLDNVTSKENIGGIFRLSDAFGVEKVFVITRDRQIPFQG